MAVLTRSRLRPWRAGPWLAHGVGGRTQRRDADAAHRVHEVLAGRLVGPVHLDQGLDHVGHFLGREEGR
jgi:hypothetical protein